jgi:hypothetical protein
MRKRKILRSFLSRQKYENLFQEKVMPVLKFLPIKTLMLSGCISDIRHKSLLWERPSDFIKLAAKWARDKVKVVSGI